MLSILICSLRYRSRQLDDLLKVLAPQCQYGESEYHVALDDGAMPIGAKRNLLVSKANGKYCCFVDDDDMVDVSYVQQILGAIRNGEPDCVGMCGFLVENGKHRWQFRHSITVSRWCKDKKNHIYFRTPNHLNPIKTEIVRRHPFPEINFGEDHAFSNSIRPDLKTEVFVERPIYFYLQGNK